MNAQPIDFKDLENTYELRKQTYQIWCNPADYHPPKKDNFWLIFGMLCLGIFTFFVGALWAKFWWKDEEENEKEENSKILETDRQLG